MDICPIVVIETVKFLLYIHIIYSQNRFRSEKTGIIKFVTGFTLAFSLSDRGILSNLFSERTHLYTDTNSLTQIPNLQMLQPRKSVKDSNSVVV